VIELFRVRRMIADQLDRDRKCARHVLIVGKPLIVAVQLMVQRAGAKNLGLQRNADGNLLLLAHYRYLGVTFCIVILTMRTDRLGGVYPITFSALRHAAA